MTNQYEELAQRAVAQGVGCPMFEYSPDATRYKIPNSHDHMGPGAFIRDGRTVLALMEKMIENHWIQLDFDGVAFWADINRMTFVAESKDSLAIAIATACLDALEGE